MTKARTLHFSNINSLLIHKMTAGNFFLHNPFICALHLISMRNPFSAFVHAQYVVREYTYINFVHQVVCIT